MYLLSGKLAVPGYTALVPGMVALGVGTGLFYFSVTTAAITAVDASRASLAGAILYMFQVAGGSIGLGMNTALVVSMPNLSEGIRLAFQVDAVLAVCGLLVSILFVGGAWNRVAGAHSYTATARTVDRWPGDQARCCSFSRACVVMVW